MKLSSCMLQTFTVINISIYDCTSPWETCPESASNSVPFSAINLSIYCCTFPWKMCPVSPSKSVQTSAINLSIYCCTFPWKTCPVSAFISAVRPSINGGCTFLGFRALDSLEIVPFMHLLLLSSLQAAPWNSSLFKLFSLECVPKNEISCTLFTLLGLFSWLFTFYDRD